jgi:hypothetical protein
MSTPTCSPFCIFSEGNAVDELKGIVTYVGIPITVSAIVAGAALRAWARNLQLQNIQAASVAIGTLATAVLDAVLLTTRWAIDGGDLSLSTMIVWLAFAAFFFAPTLIIFGPIVGGFLIHARRRESFLSNSWLYGASAVCVALQYLWVGYFGSA